MAFVKLFLCLIFIGQLIEGVPFPKATVVTAPRIVGGVDAPEGFAPHMIALVFGETVSGLVCGGSIIGPSHVLTAAHCIDAVMDWHGVLIPSLRGVYGSNQWASTEKRIKFSHYKNHKEWNVSSIKNDIGLLFSRDTFSQSERVAPISLQHDWVGEGDHSYVTGWGRLYAWGPIPDVLQFLDVETISGTECIKRFQNALAPPVDQKLEVCTIHRKGSGYGMCNGDSGSALVSKSSGQQIGIVSWGMPCAGGMPDVFTRVSTYAFWVENEVKMWRPSIAQTYARDAGQNKTFG